MASQYLQCGSSAVVAPVEGFSSSTVLVMYELEVSDGASLK